MMAYSSNYVLASKFFKNFSLEEIKKLYALRLFPINDVFEPLFTEDFDVFLGYGGRGGGKSDTVAFHLLEECENEKYFKCYYGRNVFDTVRNSFHATLVTAIELLGRENEYGYSKQPNGSLDIIHKRTGNKFIAFGGDKPDKLKSIKDPTHIVFEEADQFSLEVFTQMGATLRTIRGKNRMYLLFNTEKVNERHWIRRVFFPELSKEKPDEELQSNKKLLKIFCNYTDNYFIDQDAYYENLKLNSAGNHHQLEASARGAWGVEINKNPFFYAFNETIHTGNAKYINDKRYVDLSFDFNHTPVTLIVGQLDDMNKEVRIFDHIQADPNTTKDKTPIEAVCQIFIDKYIKTGLVMLSNIRITGDASGTQKKADRRRGEDFYTDILRYLGLKSGALYLPKKNYLHITSYEIINKVLYSLQNDNFIIDTDLIFLIEEIQKAYPSKNYSLDDAKKEFGLHALDAWRYLILLWFSPKDYEKKLLYLTKKE